MTKLNISDPLTAVQAAKLLVELIKKPGETERAADKRVREALRSGLRRGRLSRHRPVPGIEGQSFVLGELISLARGVRPWGLGASPRAGLHPAFQDETVEETATATSMLEDSTTPADLTGCLRRLRHTETELTESRQESARLRAEVAALKELVAKHEARRRAGAKRGKG